MQENHIDPLDGFEITEAQHDAGFEILTWLDSADSSYQEGVQLLARHCKNKVLLSRLMLKESQQNRAKLTYELRKLLDNPHLLRVSEEKPKEQIKPVAQKPGKSQVDRDKLAAALSELNPEMLSEWEELTLEQSEIFYEKSALSNSLAAFGESNDPNTTTERAKVVSLIADCTSRYNQLFAKKEKLENEGKGMSIEEQLSLIARYERMMGRIKVRKDRAAAHAGDAFDTVMVRRLEEQSEKEADRANQALFDEASESEQSELATEPEPSEALSEQSQAPIQESETGSESLSQAESEEPEPAMSEQERLGKLLALEAEKKRIGPNLSKAKDAAAKNPDDVKKQEKYQKLELELQYVKQQIKLLSEPPVVE